MCGIAGIVNFGQQQVDAAALKRMTNALAHRGPDGEGIFHSGGVGLGHRRLAIIDPEAGKQPFFNDDGAMVLVYNGEVYNYREIRDDLKTESVFRTRSDTEVVLHAWEKWGPACLERFRGMFAFALYDARQRAVFLVRDRVGIKPLYYHLSGKRLVFCSEFAPLLESGCVEREIDTDALAHFLRYQYVPTPLSIYKGIRKLEPGYVMRVDVMTGEATAQQFWDLKIRLSERSEDECLEALNAELDSTVRIYVRSDVPFGCFLSGGNDSSLVSALMARQLKAPVQTFSIGFNEREISELPYAAEASRLVGTYHQEKVVSSDLAVDIFEKLVMHYGEPFSDSSAIPTYYVSKEAAGKVKMVLSGDGGDELFAGYDSYQTAFRDLHPPRNWKAALFRRLARRIYGGRRYSASFPTGYGQRKHDLQRFVFDAPSLRRILQKHISLPPPIRPSIDTEGTTPDEVTLFQAQDFKTYLVDDVLTKVDRASMANSLEVRVPLLDHKLVELAFSLPLDFKIRPGANNGELETKYLLKKSAERFFPSHFLSRRKMGFGIPIIQWTKNDLRPTIERELGNKANDVFEWIAYDETRMLLKRFYNGDVRLSARIWSLLNLSTWMKNIHNNHSVCPA
jgi:asparagine synthase (glutamine-hydrolysing)